VLQCVAVCCSVSKLTSFASISRFHYNTLRCVAVCRSVLQCVVYISKTYIHVYIHIHKYIYMYIYIHTSIYIYIYTNIYTHIHTHTQTHAHTYTHTHVALHVCARTKETREHMSHIDTHTHVWVRAKERDITFFSCNKISKEMPLGSLKGRQNAIEETELYLALLCT